MSREIKSLVEGFQAKFNPSGTDSGRRIANREIGKKVAELLESKKLDPARVSFKSLFESLVGPVGADSGMELVENLSSSAFPNIAGQIISKVMIDGYKEYPEGPRTLSAYRAFEAEDQPHRGMERHWLS
jgi:hypothetical protein